ncbi:hypothetical protein DPMN_139398 [Dreissena polymorpha]|uniref:Uncharacterized protein n=1 Tax=Dreissena polymorpha TaxID=45954 RepID=A0A9D4G5S0_DREPO|nr:hypothetical protein DPMN_139398 [Dreissena polymorpha]
MATLAVTGRRLHPRDGFPSALSVLSTAAPGSLYKATPLDVHGTAWPPQLSSSRPVPCVPHTGGLAVPLSRPPTDGTSGSSGPANSRR